MAAAGFALAAGFLWQAYFAAKGEMVELRERSALAAIEAKSLRLQAEAARIISDRRLADSSAGLQGNENEAHWDAIPLVPPSGDSPAALALALWSPARQEGSLVIHRLPVPPADRSYRLWIVDPALPAPLPAGIVAFDTPRGIRLPFKASRPVTAAARFVITIEPATDGATMAGPVVLSSQ